MKQVVKSSAIPSLGDNHGEHVVTPCQTFCVHIQLPVNHAGVGVPPACTSTYPHGTVLCTFFKVHAVILLIFPLPVLPALLDWIPLGRKLRKAVKLTGTPNQITKAINRVNSNVFEQSNTTPYTEGAKKCTHFKEVYTY